LTANEQAALAQLAERAADHLVFAESRLPPVVPREDSSRPMNVLRTTLPVGKRYRRPVRTWAVGMVTSPRRQPTLEIALDSLLRAGWDQPYLFLDGTVRVPERFGRLPGVLREPRVGCWPSYYLALAELLMRHPEADAYLLAEDDALVYDREVLREYLEEMLWPERRSCLVSLYCPSLNTRDEPGWHSLQPGWAVGTLAFIFPRRLAQDFLLDPGVCAHRWDHWHQPDGGLAGTDMVIARWALRKRVRIWYPTPSLIQHIGATSTLDLDLQADGERRASCWIGSAILASSTKSFGASGGCQPPDSSGRRKDGETLEHATAGGQTQGEQSVEAPGAQGGLREPVDRGVSR
jgi:hypothetical protein